MSTIRVAIVGVGNCASSLVQGVHYYKDADPAATVPGLMHVDCGGYHVGDLRFVAAFERMQFQGHVIRIAVPSEALREEILRNKTELLLRIAETSGVQGMLELDVTVNEEIRAARPIKLEDRVKYMTEKNPLLAELRRALDLEVE